MYEGNRLVKPFYPVNPTEKSAADRLAEKRESFFVFIKQASLLLSVVAVIFFYVYLKSTPAGWSHQEQRAEEGNTSLSLPATAAPTVDPNTITSPTVGASEATIGRICGKPDRVSTTTTTSGARSTWIYKERKFDSDTAHWEVVNTRCDGHMFLFEKGKVIAMSDSY